MHVSVEFGRLVAHNTIGFSISGDNNQGVVEYGQFVSSKFFTPDQKSSVIKGIVDIVEQAEDLFHLVDKVVDLVGLIVVIADVIVRVFVQL